MTFIANIPSAQQAAFEAAKLFWSQRPALVDFVLNRRAERARLMRLASILGGAMQRARQAGDATEVATVQDLQRPIMEGLQALNELDAIIEQAVAEAKRRGWLTSAAVQDAGLASLGELTVLTVLAIIGVILGIYAIYSWEQKAKAVIASNERIRVVEIEARVQQGLPVEQSGPQADPTDVLTQETGKVVRTVAIIGAIVAALGIGIQQFRSARP